MFNSNKPFRPPTKNQLAVRGLVFAGVIGLTVGLIEMQHNGVFGGTPELKAIVNNAGGSLLAKSDVKDHGVIVGYVTSISSRPDGRVDVNIAMKNDTIKTVPADVIARILPANVFGTSYLDLASPTDDIAKVGALKAGATIQPDTSKETIELQDALDDINDLVNALSPAQLASALGSFASALDGRGTTIGETAVEFDSYLAKLQPEIPTLRADIAKAAQALDVINKVSPGLLSATSHALNLLDTLVQHQADLDTLLKAGINLSNTSKDFLAKNSAQLVQWLHDVSQVTDALYDNRKIGITGLIQINAILGNIIKSATTSGYVKIDAVVTTTAPRGY